MESGVMEVVEEADGKLSTSDLVRMFEDSEEATTESRKASERDRDYYDNKQLTSTEIKALEKRGQPPVIINRIKRKIDFLVGLEKSQRIDPRMLPRTPRHEQDAEAASQALREVADTNNYDQLRSAVWRNLLIEGAGGVRVYAEMAKGQYKDDLMSSTTMTPAQPEWDIKIARVAWDRMFVDPHSSELDFSDAAYLGLVVWMDYDEAVAKYPDAQDALDTTMQSSTYSDTYDDKPKYKVWADTIRKRVRICQIWVRREDEWYFAEYTKGGILKAGVSPYKTDKGVSDCELIYQSAYVNRDNERYGVVREMISPQDEINKRRSKALHLLSTAQIITEEGAVLPQYGIDRLKREAAKPDGVIMLAPGGVDKFRFETRTDLAASQFQMLQEAKTEIDMMAGNVALQGDALSKSSASGKAIIASQQGGMMELGDLLDSLRHLDIRVFRAVWNRIRQFWTAEKWVRVTDDERNVQWVGLNIDPMRAQEIMGNPQSAEKIKGIVGSVAELDCDIIIDAAPDSVTPALEQWQALVELAKSGVPIPPDLLIESAPNLKNKDKIRERMAQPDPAAQMQQELAVRGAQADIQETEASAAQKQAQAMKTMQEAQLAPMQFAEKAQMDRVSLSHKAQDSEANRQIKAQQVQRAPQQAA